MRKSGVGVEDKHIEVPLLTDNVIAESATMREVMTMVEQIALYPTTTVLLQGESGTGKDVIARAIHQLSRRAAYNFVGINCAALPETLLETELFGVEAGAFTDAKASREGHLLRADGGTLLLDEIGTMPRVLQAKLLRFLETHSFHRVGSTKEIHVDLRVIAATNADLQTAVAEGLFRDDLYYRLKVMTITLPPLRERVEDIEPLVTHFLQLYGHDVAMRKEHVHITHITHAALKLLQQYSWPGNIRELRSVIQRGLIVCNGHELAPEDLPENIRSSPLTSKERLWEIQQQLHLPCDGIDLPAFLRNVEKTFIKEALERCDGNQSQAAILLGLSRDQLRYRLLA